MVLNERRRHRDAPFDAHPVSRATLADIDVRRFEEDYLPKAFDPELLAANDRTTEERLAATRMIASVDDPVPTVVGMLVFGRRPHHFIPGAYIQFLRMGGTEFPAAHAGWSRPRNFGQPGAADYRNPSLAESMRVLGLVQRFGVGIGIARTALRRNAQPEPFFDVQPNWVRCVVRARPGAGGLTP